ncbi:MAG: hypothetical protein ACF8XB_17920, partial [Planctomycetota bacterium JB042]
FRMIRAHEPPGKQAPDVRMLVDHGIFDIDANDVDESTLQRVRFVRSCPEERTDNRLRTAGDRVGGTAGVSDVVTDVSELDVRAARATGGMAEVAYATARLPEKGADPALLSLYRMFRTPIGRDDSLFRSAAFDDPKKLDAEAVLLAENVLYFGVELWSRDTRSFDDPPNSDTGPLTVWDSTRGVLLDRIGANRFLLAKDEASLGEAWDDVFPRRLRFTLVVDADEDQSGELRLADAVTASTNRIRIDSPRAVRGETPFPYVKVEAEWMRWTAAEDGWLTVERGVRGTTAMEHEAGARVRTGRSFQRVIELPVFREDWNDG